MFVDCRDDPLTVINLPRPININPVKDLFNFISSVLTIDFLEADCEFRLGEHSVVVGVEYLECLLKIKHVFLTGKLSNDKNDYCFLQLLLGVESLKLQKTLQHRMRILLELVIHFDPRV